MKQLTLPDEAYSALAEIAAEKGQTPEAIIQEWIAEQQWKAQAHAALAEYAVWKATHEPEILTEEEFFAELASLPFEDATDADV